MSIVMADPSRRDQFQFLTKTPLPLLTHALHKERASVVALVLQQLPLDRRASLLRQLDDVMQRKVVKQLAHVRHYGAEQLEIIARGLWRSVETLKKQGMSPLNDAPSGNLQTVANMLREMPTDDLMAQLKDEEPELYEALSRGGIGMEDVCRLAPKGMAELLRQLSDDDIAKLFQGAGKDHQSALACGLSSRRKADILLLVGRYDDRDVAQATSSFLQLVNTLNKSGQLIIPRDGEEYV